MTYFDLNNRLKLKRLDEDGYDVVRFRGEEYKFAMGYDRFTENMLKHFPGERKALENYVSKLKEINKSVDIYNVRDFKDTNAEYFKYFSIGIDQLSRFDHFKSGIEKCAGGHGSALCRN